MLAPRRSTASRLAARNDGVFYTNDGPLQSLGAIGAARAMGASSSAIYTFAATRQLVLFFVYGLIIS